ncbi:MAG: hypothetical protein NTY59_05965, partial [Alphaproteobacteria bacterium]|nr:hypothetical protein [Alphaproteobacteria bacterium]
WEPLNKEEADKAMTAFLKMLDQRIYGTSGKRFGRYLRSADVMEGGRRHLERAHRHLLLEVPSDRMNFDRFSDRIRDTWPKIRWGHREIDIQRCVSIDAVTTYMLKKGLTSLRLRTTRF